MEVEALPHTPWSLPGAPRPHVPSGSTRERNRAATLTCLHDSPRGPGADHSRSSCCSGSSGDGEPAQGPLPGHPHHPQAVHLLLGLLLPTPKAPPSPPHTLLVSAARLGSFLHRVQRRPLWRMAQTPPHPDPPPPCLPAPGWVSLFAECLPTRKGKPTHRSCTPVPAKRHST